jgi:epimerase EvaD
MHARKLEIDGAYEFSPVIYPDDRGRFLSFFQEPAFTETLGHKLFPVAQVSQNRSRRGVLRGVHFTRTPPGQPMYVYCPRGKALDMQVDLRVGSPTFGRWDATVLDDVGCRSLYLPVGVGHAFVALEDDTDICYLLARSYVPANELAICPLDPELDLPVPADLELIMSEQDRTAPALAEAADLLPRYEECLAVDRSFAESLGGRV